MIINKNVRMKMIECCDGMLSKHLTENVLKMF